MANRTVEDCHWLPQWQYLARTDGGWLPDVAVYALPADGNVFPGMVHLNQGGKRMLALKQDNRPCGSAIQLSAETQAEVRQVYAKNHALYTGRIRLCLR